MKNNSQHVKYMLLSAVKLERVHIMLIFFIALQYVGGRVLVNRFPIALLVNPVKKRFLENEFSSVSLIREKEKEGGGEGRGYCYTLKRSKRSMRLMWRFKFKESRRTIHQYNRFLAILNKEYIIYKINENTKTVYC